MTFKLVNRVRMSVSNAPGTGVVIVNQSALGFQSFVAAGMADGDQTPYLLEDGSPTGSIWEIGQGTWHSNGTFSRDTVTQSSAGGTTAITASASAVINATFRASDLSPGLLSALQDVDITSPNQDQILRYNQSTGQWDNKTSILPTYFVQAAGGVLTTAGTLDVTLPQSPTNGNLLIGFAYGGGGVTGGNRVPAIWSGWDYVNGDFDTLSDLTSFALRVAGGSESASCSTVNLTTGSSFAIAGVFEVNSIDLTRFNVDTLRAALIDNVTSNPTTLSQRVLSVRNALTLYFYGGPSASVSVTGPSVDASGNSGGYAYVVGHKTSTGGVDTSSTTVNGTGDCSIQMATFTGFS